jgi:hypothetical protein
MGDINDRVNTGIERDLSGGPYGEETKNGNGETLTYLFLAHDLVITNSKFSHKFTRIAQFRTIKCKDEKGYRDHCLLIMQTNRWKKCKGRKNKLKRNINKHSGTV